MTDTTGEFRGGMRICSYHWRYAATTYQNKIHVDCVRQSGPVYKTTSLVVTLEQVNRKPMSEWIEAHLNDYAEKNGA